MNNETFFNIEFYRTLLSVLIGGLISLGSVLIVEYSKNRKEKTERKRAIFNGLISTINQIRRIEIKFGQSGLGFSYQKRIFELENDNLAKQQAEYNQRIRDESIDQIISKAEVLDSFSIKYKILKGKDEKFDEIMRGINNWPRPNSPDYSDIKSTSELNQKFDNDFKLFKQQTEKYWYEIVEKMNKHLTEELL